jgi:hypothetical protein
MKKALTLLFIFFFYCSGLLSQSEYASALEKQFINYQQQALPEKIFIHTDKEFYVGGEIIWLKLYYVDGLLHQPLSLSKVAYVEIINAEQKVVLQAKLALIQGSANGSFMLPLSLSSGNYLIRGYTSWMKNFDADYFFKKSITIVNTLRRPDWEKIERTVGYDLQFFPEGGNLVSGLQSKIAFKATDQYGKGIECRGFVLNEKNDTVAQLETHRFGMGQFNLKPATGSTYYALIQFTNGDRFKKELPSAYASGYTLNVEDSAENNIRISVTSNIPSIENTSVYLFTHTRQIVKGILHQKLKDGKTVFTIDRNGLGEGISHFTVFNEARQPVCERLYFKRPQQKLEINVELDRKAYNTRSKVLLDVAVAQVDNTVTGANLSLSVFLLDSLQTAGGQDINAYLWLASDLKGVIESPEDYFNDSSGEVKQALENLLLTQGWRRFRWEEIKQQQKPYFKYLPEYEGHVISGKVTDRRTGAAVAGIRSFLTVLSKNLRLSSTESDAEGRVYFVVNKAFGTKDIIVQTADSSYLVSINTPFSDSFPALVMPAFRVQEKWKNDLLKHSLGSQAANAYYKESLQVFDLPYTVDTTAFYGAPDKRYYFDDYTRFTTMEEVLREYVPEVRVRRNNEQFHFQVKNTPYKTYFANDPLVLLDGVPVKANSLMTFDPLKIKKLEVVAREFYINDLVNKGIVSFSTYDEDLNGFELPANAVIIEYDGLQLSREFYSPAYEPGLQSQARLPDFRNLLYWSPEIKPDEQGKKRLSFYTSDLPGNYAIVIQGINKTGAAGSAVITFTVTK